jgi:tetratricopeptide (TPR) repeat protein
MARLTQLVAVAAFLFAAGASAAETPISLSDADGQELILEDLSAKTSIEGMLSLTELDLRFRNPKAKRIEGRFNCTLPATAAISRFAKEVNGTLMEGEVVERLRANQIYEQFLHQMRDPALLEQDQGNRFSARIFPIEANQSVRIVLSYTMLLPLHDGVRRYSLPLRGIPSIHHFTFRAFVSALPGEEGPGAPKSGVGGLSTATHSMADVISLDESDYAPSQDIELTWRPTSAASRTRLLKAGEFYLAAFRPNVPASAAAAANHAWTFYVDTSASSAEGAEHRIHALESILASLPPSDSVEIVAFDQEIVSLGNGTAAELSRSIGSLLRTRLFLGGTDLAALFRHIAKRGGDRTIVVASDLVPTLGETDAHALNDAVQALPQRMTIHALILGSRQNAAMAKALTAGHGRIVTVPFSESLDAASREAAGALRRPIGSSFDVADRGAEWVYPSHFDDVRSGDEIIVLGRMKPASEPAPHLGGAAPDSDTQSLPAAAFGPLLEREAYRAYLDYLAEREASESTAAVRSALATEQVKVSIERRVVIPRTTMLVLESEWDYQRFGLDRRTLASILTIDAGGIGVIDRRDRRIATTTPVQPPPAPPRSKAALPPPAPAEAEGGVEAGVVGGVVGGVLGGVVTDAAPMAVPNIAESITVTQGVPVPEAPPRVERPESVPAVPRPAPPPPATGRVTAPPQPRREEKKANIDWTKPPRPTQSDVEELEKKLAADPRDRDVYNRLSDAYAARSEWTALRRLALQWQPYDPENPQVYEILGIADEHLGNAAEAARADASLIEIAPAKSELLQRAGLLLLRTHHAALAETPLRRALEARPDRVNGYRHLALMLWREGRIEEAAGVLESATRQQFPQWYLDVQRVVREELGYVYRAWIAKSPERRSEIEQRARDYHVDLARRDALRITLAWETDANDVDLHVVDPDGEECFYNHKTTALGLELYEDITQGLGPEVVRAGTLKKGTYHVGVNYFAAGPMGVSRGIVVVLRGDDVEIYPFRLIEGGTRDMRYIAAVEVK